MRNPVLPSLILCFYATLACASDWPMWRYDTARTAASPNEVPAKPVLLWYKQLQPVRQAWPLEPNQRLDFDASYEPVVMGKLLFLASPNDGSVTAYETETGKEKWKFFTEGPVRCAPACSNGKIYVGSDDGFLYCLNALTGEIEWKFRGAPKNRPDFRQLGNNRLVSFWPVRGGPVIKDDVLYFGAGVWPIFGTFIYALDPETGEIKWRNDKLNYIANVRGQASFKLDTGLSPQGCFGLIDGKLVVPCGRSLPAGIDAATGKLIFYDQGMQKGESRVASHGDYAFVGSNGLVRLSDFHEFGNRRQQYGKLPYKLVAGCDAASVFDNGISYGLVNGVFYTYDVENARVVDRKSKVSWGNKNMTRWEPAILWQYQTPYSSKVKPRGIGFGRPSGYDANPGGSPLIKAGTSLYGAAGKQLLALSHLDGPPRITWKKELDETPSSIIAADQKLFVATAEGGLYCFGKGKRVRKSIRKQKPISFKKGKWTEKAAKIIKESGAKDGYCLVLGLSKGELADALLSQSKMFILAVDADSAKIATLRRQYAQSGLLGSRIDFFVAKPGEFLFPPYIANLIVSENLDSLGFPNNVKAKTLFNFLRPYGGTICLNTQGKNSEFDTWSKAVPLPGSEIKHNTESSMIIRKGPLPGSASWTHVAGNAANTYCSADDLVKAPLGFLWYGDVRMAWPEYPGSYIIKFAVSGGLVYQHGARGRTFMLNVYDAYTGRSLWSKKIKAKCRRASSVMTNDGIYFVLDNKCLLLDPKTGKELKTFNFKTKDRVATNLRVTDKEILIMCTNKNEDSWRAVLPGYLGDVSSELICFDRETGAELWRRESKERFHDFAIAAGANMFFLVDSIPLYTVDKTIPKDKKPKELPSTVIAIDARTGKQLWSRKVLYDSTRVFTRKDYATGVDDRHLRKPYARDWLAYDANSGTVLAGRFMLGNAFESKTGKQLWQNKEIRGTAPMVIRDENIITSGGRVYNILTGDLKENYKGVKKKTCAYAVASKHLIMSRFNNAGYYDAGQDKTYQLRNIRSSCSNNMLAADGLINSPCFTPGDCNCNFPIQTSFAMIHMPEVSSWSGETPVIMKKTPVTKKVKLKTKQNISINNEGKK